MLNNKMATHVDNSSISYQLTIHHLPHLQVHPKFREGLRELRILASKFWNKLTLTILLTRIDNSSITQQLSIWHLTHVQTKGAGGYLPHTRIRLIIFVVGGIFNGFSVISYNIPGNTLKLSDGFYISFTLWQRTILRFCGLNINIHAI